MELQSTIALFLFFCNYLISADIRLAWANPDTASYESSGGRCVMMDTTFGRRLIYGNVPEPPSEFPKGPTYYIIVGAGVPALFVLTWFLCFICTKTPFCRRGALPVIAELLGPPVARKPITLVGLDGPIFELGESQCLSKPDDKICPICLAEYQPNETLRTIPECQHCFHADCIDEWLQLNACCPVCYDSPGTNPLSISEAP